MAFNMKTWVDRITEYPTRRRLRKEDGSDELVTVSREEGQVSEEGDAFSAENMNDLESRIDSAFKDVNNSLGEIKHSANIVGNVTCAYGSCNNLVCSCFVYDGIALCTIKMDSCRGVFDIYLSSFGLPSDAKISNMNNPRLATNVVGINGQALNVNCVSGGKSVQISCGETADSYNFMFPVIIVLPNNK